VRIRYRADVTAAQRVVHEERTLEIVSPPIDPEERHAELELLCREVQ
jgi:SPP1 family predicted phage head-tail adaptor